MEPFYCFYSEVGNSEKKKQWPHAFNRYTRCYRYYYFFFFETCTRSTKIKKKASSMCNHNNIIDVSGTDDGDLGSCNWRWIIIIFVTVPNRFSH